MEYRVLGRSGMAVSVVGLGAANFGRALDRSAADAVASAALDSGINYIDTAEAYPGSEALVGEVLRGRRDRFILATKFGHPHQVVDDPPGSRRSIRKAIEGSLRRLQTDYVDLYYLHFPDPRTPVEETLGALDELLAEGKIRYAGASNFTGEQARTAEDVARNGHLVRFAVHQNRCSLIERDVEVDVMPACRVLGLGFIAYAPLARGLLTGRYRRGAEVPKGARLADAVPEDAAFDKVEAISSFAEARGLSALQVSLGGLLAQPGVSSMVVGASSSDQLLANIAAAEWLPTTDDLRALNAACGLVAAS